MNVEECLLRIEGKAALLRYLAASATMNPEQPDRAVLAGMDDVCSEIEKLARAAKESLVVEALCAELKARRSR